MEIPVKIVIGLIFPVLSTIIYFVVRRPWRSYFVSGLLFLFSLLVLGVSRVEVLGPVNDSFFFPLMFSVEDSYANLLRFALALTGSAVLLYNASLKDRLFHIAVIWAISSGMILTLAENFLTFFLFWEMVTLSTAGIIFLAKDDRAYKNGIIYLLTHLTGGLFLLLGILKHYDATGSLLLERPQAGIAFFLVAIGIKTAFIPLHFWLVVGYPSASWRGTVVLSTLSTKVGVYAVARVLEPTLVVAYMGGIMAVFGVLMALLQKKMRPLLCYHIISQVGYMVAGVGLGLALSVDGGLLHLLNHMLYKALLLMSAGAVIYAVGTEKLKYLGSLARKIPVVSVTALIGSLAISGFPPFNGFISKTMLKYGTENERILSLLLLIAGVGTVMSFSKFMYFGFLRTREKSEEKIKVKTLPWGMKFALIFTSVLVVLLGVFPNILRTLTPYQSSTFVYSLSAVRESLLIGGAGVCLFIILKPLLDPRSEFMIHRLLGLFNSKLDSLSGTVYVRAKNSVLKDGVVNTSSSLWFILFAAGLFISFFLINILLI